MRAVIVQSCYIPWKGYFDLIAHADHFVILDEVQYSRGSWRNRNRIKTAKGLHWLTIPLRHSGTFPSRILDMRIDSESWFASHRAAIEQSYRDSPGWDTLRQWLGECREAAASKSLSEVNEALIRSLCGLLGIRTAITQSTQFGVQCEDPTERLVRLCRALGADRYLSGPAAKSYLDEDRLADAGIALEYFDYSGYVAYPQAHGPFEHAVSIIDAIAALGPAAAGALQRLPGTPYPCRLARAAHPV